MHCSRHTKKFAFSLKQLISFVLFRFLFQRRLCFQLYFLYLRITRLTFYFIVKRSTCLSLVAIIRHLSQEFQFSSRAYSFLLLIKTRSAQMSVSSKYYTSSSSGWCCIEDTGVFACDGPAGSWRPCSCCAVIPAAVGWYWFWKLSNAGGLTLKPDACWYKCCCWGIILCCCTVRRLMAFTSSSNLRSIEFNCCSTLCIRAPIVIGFALPTRSIPA